MPQWDFLDLRRRAGQAVPDFRLHMGAEVTDVIEDGGRVRGVDARTPTARCDVRADLVVGADGRHSTVRERRAAHGRGDRRAHRRAVVAPAARPRGATATRRLHRRPRSMIVTIPRPTTGSAGSSSPRAASTKCRRPGIEAFRARDRRGGAAARGAGRRPSELGRREAAHGADRSAAAVVACRGCCASATRRTRCRRWSASASTRHPGCGRGREHPGAGPAGHTVRRRGPRRGGSARAAAPATADRDDAAPPGGGPPHDRQWSRAGPRPAEPVGANGSGHRAHRAATADRPRDRLRVPPGADQRRGAESPPRP